MAATEQRRRLWGLAYRLTGSAADADDVVQETFVRWLERTPASPPSDGWLVRVATRIGIDTLRARRRRAYVGPWLPSPVPDETDDDPATRYGRAESATVAFLIALEALTPRARAVLLLRDVLGHSAAETAVLLGATESSVRVMHLRARRALADYDRARTLPSPEVRTRHRAVLERFLAALASQDARALEALLVEDVRTRTDGGGHFTALRVALRGRARVARFYLRAARQRAAAGVATRIVVLNGLPAAVLTLARPVRRQAPVVVLSLALTADGRVREIDAVMAPPKLTAVM